MAKIIYPMTKKQLVGYVKCYEPHFAGWELLRREFFLRASGPVAQVVGFEALRSGAYRPSTGIRILVAPGAAMLHQFLDLKHRDVLPRQHESAFPGMLAAMDEQFVPAIRQPLDPEEVCRLCDEAAQRRLRDAYGLSALHAYLGNSRRAAEWLEILDAAAEERKDDLFDAEVLYIKFANQLREQLETGDVRGFLDEARDQELNRLRTMKG